MSACSQRGLYRARHRIFTSAALALALSACVQSIKEDRTRTALIHAGLPSPIATCMAQHLAQRLTVAQLHQLQALDGPKRTWMDYVDAVNRVQDPAVLKVLIDAYTRCQPGRAN